ncbi:MAG: MBL fold metallo-hydrolase [Nitrospinota bacterium]|nr:MBL fold metallo-hydrolase [Nitrospinota bacterium]
MKLTVLGSGTAVPDLQRNSAGYLLEANENRFLIDFGYGNLHQLLRLGVTYHDIDRIFFTHHHPDHMCDLIPFLFASKYPLDPRTRNLQIVAGTGFAEYYGRMEKAFNHWLTPESYQVQIIEMDAETFEFDGLEVTSGRVQHIEMSRGFRFTYKGKSIVFSGDTDICEGIVNLARGADLLVLECSTPDDMKVEKHLTPQLCGKIAQEAGCKTLLLSHFYPPCHMDAVRVSCSQNYSGQLILAEDLTVIDL